jgi:diacylglycerol kinase
MHKTGSMIDQKQSSQSFWDSLGHALAGWLFALRNESNFGKQVVLASCATAAGVGFACSRSEWLLMMIGFAFLLTAELFNSCIERLCNLHTRTFHPEIKRIKDLSAGAVLLIAVAVGFLLIFIFLPKIIQQW